MYAIIRTGGKQYQVTPGERLRVEKLVGNIGDSIEIDDVLLVVDGEDIKVGYPVLVGAKVSARIVEQDKAKKIIVFHKKRRAGHRVKNGHRQPFFKVKIESLK